MTLDEWVTAAKVVFQECDKENKGYLDERMVAAGINLLFPRPAFGPGGPGGDFGLGNFIARPLLEALDTDRNGRVSMDELVAGVAKFFRESDKDQEGKIDEKTIAVGLRRILP